MQAAKQGRIELIIGPMFSGKTSELLRYLKHAYQPRRVRRLIIANQNCVIGKYAKDDRYNGSKDYLLTHD